MVCPASPDSSRRPSEDAGQSLVWAGEVSLFVTEQGRRFVPRQSTQEEQMGTDRATAVCCDVGIERYRDVEGGKM